MALHVRVRNFQSIRDASVVIDGFTVITGTNNSGKSSLIRAIRGVFTNPPAGPLVRHGAGHLSVEIRFPDGQAVLWEKGWEKPGQKGATINRYTLNGKRLSHVGRGVPPEVEALGVHAIQAGTEKLWPQVAEQFKGTLFLIGASGATVAEAVADVDRVGKLSDALKLSEKDRRAVANTLKVRRKDERALAEELASFDGLDNLISQVNALSATEDEIRKVKAKLDLLRSLRERLHKRQVAVEALAGVASVTVPGEDEARKATSMAREIAELVRIRSRLEARRSRVAYLRGVESVPTIPAGREAEELGNRLSALFVLRDRHVTALREVERLSSLHKVDIPQAPATDRVLAALSLLRGLQTRRLETLKRAHKVESDLAEYTQNLNHVEDEIHEILDGAGVCPVCRRPMEA